MKKFYAILAAVCLFTACSNGETASETTAALETASVTDTATVSETTITESATDISPSYTYNFAERLGGTSDEQTELYEFFEENSDNTELFKNIDDSRAQMSENENLSSAVPENYDIYAHEFFADFDGDGDGELYVCRVTNIYPQSPWGIYQELWYTDGESCVQVDSSTGRGLFGGILKPLDGVPLMYIIPEIGIGSAVQLADVYIIKDGNPVLYELPEGERFLYDGSRAFISLDGGGSDGYKKLLELLDETRDDPDSFQTLGWVDGELKIISGYGAETTAAETAKTAASADYTLNYKRYGNPSEEQDRLYEFLSENWHDTEFYKEIDDFRTHVNVTEYDEFLKPDDYNICNDEYFADFDGDGDGELYVYKYVDINPSSQWTVYRELWYTDGESCAMIYSSMGRGSIGGILEPRDGVPLMYIVPDIYIGAHSANVYFIKDGKPVLYELPEGECFMYDDNVEILFIAPSGGDEVIDTPESPQTIGWVDGELKIISGYGENGAENT